jgi:hypothetical protein
MSSCLCVLALLHGCSAVPSKQPLPTTWTTGFWVWGGQSSPSPLTNPLDAAYIQVSESEYFPDTKLPAAKEYWAVYRFEGQSVPPLSAAAEVQSKFERFVAEARRQKRNVVGIQLDIDSPTSHLGEYATFLAAVKKTLPQGTKLSITALLDWFRDGTDIVAVIDQVDEFVPQFYDIAKPQEGGNDQAIAAKVDAAKWGPRFNRFGKPYRIGISTFGRARFVSDHAQTGSPTVLYREVTPLDLGSQFALSTSRNDAGEVVLTYRASQEVSVEYQSFQQGEGVQFIVPTPAGVRAATAEAKKMGEYAAGVVYFRWPGEYESLFVSAAEILGEEQVPVVETADGGCVAVKCVDVTLRHSDRFATGAVRYRVRSSQPLDYFLPAERIPARLSAPNEVELVMPPYAGRDRLALGRAVSADAVTFTVEAVR